MDFFFEERSAIDGSSLCTFAGRRFKYAKKGYLA
jgi:hypothetical protein